MTVVKYIYRGKRYNFLIYFSPNCRTEQRHIFSNGAREHNHLIMYRLARSSRTASIGCTFATIYYGSLNQDFCGSVFHINRSNTKTSPTRGSPKGQYVSSLCHSNRVKHLFFNKITFFLHQMRLPSKFCQEEHKIQELQDYQVIHISLISIIQRIRHSLLIYSVMPSIWPDNWKGEPLETGASTVACLVEGCPWRSRRTGLTRQILFSHMLQQSDYSHAVACCVLEQTHCPHCTYKTHNAQSQSSLFLHELSHHGCTCMTTIPGFVQLVRDKKVHGEVALRAQERVALRIAERVEDLVGQKPDIWAKMRYSMEWHGRTLPDSGDQRDRKYFELLHDAMSKHAPIGGIGPVDQAQSEEIRNQWMEYTPAPRNDVFDTCDVLQYYAALMPRVEDLRNLYDKGEV